MRYLTSAAKLPANSPQAMNYFTKAIAIIEGGKADLKMNQSKEGQSAPTNEVNANAPNQKTK